MGRLKTLAVGAVVAGVVAAVAVAANNTTGPSSSQAPYVLPVDLSPSISTTSVLTVGDTPAGSSYRLVGIPDGLGAFDNGDGTFTLLVNHELSSTSGVVRAHGGKGAFVSKWVIDKGSLEVRSGADLIRSVFLADKNGAYSHGANVAFNRFCSADLPAVSALYDAASGKGTAERIFMNGEESGAEGRAFAHVVTGALAGSSYELPYLGRMAFENAVANPGTGDRTVVVEQDDTSPTSDTDVNGQVYVYAGDKKSSGSLVERAGLTGGNLYGIRSSSTARGWSPSSRRRTGTPASTFPFAAVDVSADRRTPTATGAVPRFRPEAARRASPGSSGPRTAPGIPTIRATLLRDDLQHHAGGRPRRSHASVAAPLHESEPPRAGRLDQAARQRTGRHERERLHAGAAMFDNIAVSESGQVFLEEDPGNNAYVAKQWLYDIESGRLVQIAQHDPARFAVGAPSFLTQDEESSGVIDASEILGKGWYLFDTQAHFPNGTELVEGGQLQAFHFPPGQIKKLFK